MHLKKATKILRGPNVDVSKFSPILIIHLFTSTFVVIYLATSYKSGFTSRIKIPHFDILKLLVTTFINQDNKAALVLVDEYGSLAISSVFMITCHNMKIIVQATGGGTSSLNGKS